jgi:hypothetical protein
MSKIESLDHVHTMHENLAVLSAIATFTLAACASPRVAGNPDLEKWAGQYGFKPYALHAKDTYCHASIGGSGSFCVPSPEMVKLMANNQAPPMPRNTGTVEGDVQAGR